MKSRYCYCPMTSKRLGQRLTLMDRLRRWKHRRANRVDVFPVTGYFAPIYPGTRNAVR